MHHHHQHHHHLPSAVERAITKFLQAHQSWQGWLSIDSKEYNLWNTKTPKCHFGPLLMTFLENSRILRLESVISPNHYTGLVKALKPTINKQMSTFLSLKNKHTYYVEWTVGSELIHLKGTLPLWKICTKSSTGSTNVWIWTSNRQRQYLPLSPLTGWIKRLRNWVILWNIYMVFRMAARYNRHPMLYCRPLHISIYKPQFFPRGGNLFKISRPCWVLTFWIIRWIIIMGGVPTIHNIFNWVQSTSPVSYRAPWEVKLYYGIILVVHVCKQWPMKGYNNYTC